MNDQKSLKWDDQKLAKAKDLYLTMLSQDPLYANTEAFLTEIADQVEVGSFRSVRSKLAKEKIYSVSDKPKPTKTGVKVGKKTLVEEIAKKLAIDNSQGAIDSLVKANADALKLILDQLV